MPTTTTSPFIKIPVSELSVSLKDFQGRAEAYSTQTYNRIVNAAEDGTLNLSAIPPIQIWMDPRTEDWVILAGHSRSVAFNDLAAGKHPLDRKYKPSDFASIQAQIVQADTIEEARKIAQESNAAAAQTDLENARYARKLRLESKSGVYFEKIKDLFGKNWVYVNELANLNPTGKVMNMLEKLQGISDKTQLITIEKIASYIGAAREKLPQLTNAHENELYDWLIKNIDNPKTDTKGEFISHISSRVMRLDFSQSEPLNLENTATKTYIEENWEQQILDKKQAIADKKDIYEKERQRYLSARLSVDEIEEKLDPLEKQILKMQKELAELLQKKSQITQESKSIIGLFDNPLPQESLEQDLETLLKILRMSSPGLVSETPSEPIKQVSEPIIIEPTPTISISKEQFQSFILNQSTYKFTYFTKFELTQLDYWMNTFETRFLKNGKWNPDQEAARQGYRDYNPQKITQEAKYENIEMLKQILETAVYIFANYLTTVSGSDEQTFKILTEFYYRMPNIKWRSSVSMRLQQYSTPTPISWLLARYCIAPGQAGAYYEPSAGTGQLTIGTSPAQWTANELDYDRVRCLNLMGFGTVTDYDSNQPAPYPAGTFDAMITNPPFGNNPKVRIAGYLIKKLEHRMAAFALETLKPTGRAAIIIGSTMEYNEKGMIEPFESDRVFFSYLYNYFNVTDIINVDGAVYNRMGASFPFRLILIDGRRQPGTGKEHPYFLKEIDDLAPDERNSPLLVKEFYALFKRISPHFKKA